MTQTDITQAEIAELKRLAKAATAGPWHDGGSPAGNPNKRDVVRFAAVGIVICDIVSGGGSPEQKENDAKYIAAANPETILALIAERDELKARVGELEKENFALAANECLVEGSVVGDEHGHPYCTLQKRVEELEDSQ